MPPAAGSQNNSAGTFALVAGDTFDGVLAGYVSGAAAQGISGVFATSGAAGTQYAGGFVGGAPQVASVLYEISGIAVGQANRSVFSGTAHSTGHLLILDEDGNYEYNIRDVINNAASDTVRKSKFSLKSWRCDNGRDGKWRFHNKTHGRARQIPAGDNLAGPQPVGKAVCVHLPRGHLPNCRWRQGAVRHTFRYVSV